MPTRAREVSISMQEIPRQPWDDPAFPAALSDHDRTRHRGRMAVSFTFAWRAVLKVKHVPEQLLDVTLIPVIFTLMFTYVFGGALAGSTRAYVNFLLPGSLVMAVVLVTVYTGVALNSDITTGVFDRFRSMPIWPAAPFVGGLL